MVVSWSFVSPAFAISDLDNYFKLLSELRYNDAKDQTKKFSDLRLRELSQTLVEILYLRRQQEKEFVFEEIQEENTTYLSLYLLSQGYYEMYTNRQSARSFEIFKKAFEVAQETKNTEIVKQALLGIIENFNADLVQYNIEYEYFLDEYKKRVKRENENYWVYCYNIRFSSQRFKENAVPYIQKQTGLLKQLVSKLDESHPYRANYYSYQGYSYEKEKEFELAIKNYDNSIQVAKELPYLKYIAFRSSIRQAEIHRAQKKYEEALNALEESKKYLDRSDTLTGLHYVYYYKASNYAGLEQYKSAYSSFVKAYEYEHQLNTLKNSVENSNLAIQLKTSEKDKQRLRNKNIAIVLGGSLLTVSLTAFLLFKNTKKKQRIAEQEKELEIQKTEKILKEQELTSIDAMIEGQEKERQRLASDLHDSVGATLSAARLQFDHISKNKDNLSKLDELFEKTGSLLDDAYNEVRSMAHLKNSGVIAKNGLLPAVEKLAKNASGTNKLKVEVEDFGLENRLENTLEITIFRIIQELVTNVIKHANASEATISITQHKDSLNIIVEDNGQGFDAQKFQQKEGMGLSGIERRIEHLEGTLEVDSSLGNGTSVLIDIPL